MKRKLMALGGVAVVVLGLVYVARPAGHVPPYDANLTRLAESELQGYCAGKAFWQSGGTGNKNLAAECRTQLAKQKRNEPNLLVVQQAFCQAIVDMGWEGDVDTCLGIMAANEYWPTYDGGITNAWNRARPYPRPITAGSAGSRGGQSRTGDHQGADRSDAPSRSYGGGGYYP